MKLVVAIVLIAQPLCPSGAHCRVRDITSLPADQCRRICAARWKRELERLMKAVLAGVIAIIILWTIAEKILTAIF